MSEWHELGTICRLQVQRESLKLGPRSDQRYDPAEIVAATALEVDPDGATLRDGALTVLDVHNVRHPRSKNVERINGLSVGFTAHYALIRARFGERLRDGIAGENVLVERDGPVRLAEIAGGLLIEGPDGRRLELPDVRVAHPCVPFSRFAMGDPQAPALLVSETLKILDGGVRGFYTRVPDGVTTRVEVGDRVWGRRAE